MTQPALRWVATSAIPLALALASGTVGAANFYADGNPAYYEGAVFDYVVWEEGRGNYDLQNIEVTLPNDLVLVDVLGPNMDSLSTLVDRTCGKEPVDEAYSCELSDGCTYPIQINLAPVGDTQVVTLIIPSFRSMDELRLRVRNCPDHPCGIPTAEFTYAFGDPATIPDGDFQDSCNSIVTGWQPQAVVVPRNGIGAATELIVQPVVGGVAQSSLDVPLSNPAQFAAAVQCSRSDATLAVIADMPPTISVTVDNPVEPLAGDGVIRIDWSVFGLSHPPTEIDLQVQQPVSSLQITTNPPSAGGPIAVAPGVTATLEVARAINQYGGHEPREVTWAITGATRGGDPAAVPNWLSTIDGRTAELAIPEDVFAAGGGDWAITVQATPTDAAGDYVAQDFVFVVTNDWVDTCRIVTQSATALGGTSVGLRVERLEQTGIRVLPVDDVTWPKPGWGTIRATPEDITGFNFHYDAYDDASSIHEVPSRVTLNAEVDGCEGPLPVVIELQPAFGLTLRVDKDTVMPGGLVRVLGELNKPEGMAISGVTVVVESSAAFKPLRKMPSTSLAVRKASDELDGVTLGRGGELGFVVDLPANAPTAQFSLPFMARAAFAGGAGKIVARAFYAAAQSSAQMRNTAVAKDAVEVAIVADPEFSEATLVGKVFADHNGDKVQQAGELGIANAMVAVSAGVYAITDDDGKYHIARLEPGRHSVKLNLTTLPMGSSTTTDLRRDVTLTPGVFTKVSFGVAVPNLADREPLQLDGKGSGIVLGEEGPAYRMQLTHVMGTNLVARHGEHIRVGEVNDHRAYVDLPLGDDGVDPVWMLIERAEDGRMWMSSVAVFTYQRDSGGTLVVPWGPRPVAQLLLPAAGKKVGSARLRLTGSLSARTSLRIDAGGAREACEQHSDSNESDFHESDSNKRDSNESDSNESDSHESDSHEDVAVDCTLNVVDAIDTMRLRVDPAADPHGIDAPAQEFDVDVVVAPTTHFLVGRGGVGLSFDPDGEVDKGLLGDSLDWDLGGAFFYKGSLAGGYQVTAGADAQARQVLRTKAGQIRSIGGIGAQLLAHDPRRVFRDLDPEGTYPTFGDASRTVDERESGGRFFLRVEKDDSYVKWGGINTAMDDAEMGRFVRSLYGLGGVWRLGDEDGPSLRATVFAAQPDTVPARDELTVTGGTLYFLGHRDLVEGSIRVTLEVLDEVSGLPVRAVPLTEGSDYEADYAGGRFVLDAALPHRFFATSLTSDASGGHRGRLIVEYEYLASDDLTADWSTGARLVGNLGPLSLGVTGVTELTGLSDDAGQLRSRYWLVGGTARVDLGDPMRLRLEFAHSDGGAFESRRSDDGGLSYGDAATSATSSGNAAAVELSAGVGEVQGGVYGRYVEAGFTDSRNALGKRLVQGGVRVSGGLPSRTKLWGNYDHLETRLFDADLFAMGTATRTGLQVRDLGLVGASQRLGKLELGLEGRYESEIKRDAHRALVGVEADYQLTSAVELSLRRRQRVSADGSTKKRSADGESAAGIIIDDGWRLAAEVGIDDELEVFGRAQGNFPVTEDTELYAGYQIASRLGVGLLDEQLNSGSSVVAGGRRSLDDGTLLYSEQNLRVDGSERMLGRTVGARVPLTKQVGISVTYERGALDNELVADNRVLRDAASIGGTFANERWSVRLLADGRLDRRGDTRSAQLAGHGRLEYRATDDLTLALAGRGGSGFRDNGAGNLDADRRAWEGALGFALRPLERDDINLFGRYALVYERDRDGSNGDATGSASVDAPWLASTSHVIAAVVVYDVWGPFGISPKVAYRHTHIDLDGDQATDQALLAALRGDIHVTESWDATLEGRVCAVPNSRVDATVGALAELSLLVIDWLRMGAGYNFSPISAQGVSCNEPGARGLFLRAEAVY